MHAAKQPTQYDRPETNKKCACIAKLPIRRSAIYAFVSYFCDVGWSGAHQVAKPRPESASMLLAVILEVRIALGNDLYEQPRVHGTAFGVIPLTAWKCENTFMNFVEIHALCIIYPRTHLSGVDGGGRSDQTNRSGGGAGFVVFCCVVCSCWRLLLAVS